MNFGIQRYVDENYKDHVFSEMLYDQGIISGANVDCAKNYGDFGAKCILISSISISVIPDKCFGDVCIAATITFTDINGRTIFVFDQSEAITGIYDFLKVIDGPQLFLRCNNTNVKFSLAHQYLTVREKRWQDPSK